MSCLEADHIDSANGVHEITSAPHDDMLKEHTIYRDVTPEGWNNGARRNGPLLGNSTINKFS
jgi:hypothetical protein